LPAIRIPLRETDEDVRLDLPLRRRRCPLAKALIKEAKK
jgi:hypothetical protein